MKTKHVLNDAINNFMRLDFSIITFDAKTNQPSITPKNQELGS